MFYLGGRRSSSVAGVPEVLTRFQGVVGVGRTYGPYGSGVSHAPVYRYRAQRLAEVEHVIRATWPWLGSVKRVQAMSVIALVRSQAQLPRGNPAWGHHKTHCVHGHQYATARVRAFRSRAGGSEKRLSSSCLTCLREHARRKRAEKMKLGS